MPLVGTVKSDPETYADSYPLRKGICRDGVASKRRRLSIRFMYISRIREARKENNDSDCMHGLLLRRNPANCSFTLTTLLLHRESCSRHRFGCGNGHCPLLQCRNGTEGDQSEARFWHAVVVRPWGDDFLLVSFPTKVNDEIVRINNADFMC